MVKAEVLLDAVGHAIIATDTASVITYINHRAQRIFGWGGDVVGARWDDIAPFSGFGAAQRGVLDALSGSEWEGEISIPLPDGSRIQARLTATPIVDSSGAVTGALMVMVDVSAAAEAENGLRRLAAIVESSTDAILSKSIDGTILTWNSAAARLYGFSETEVIGRHISILVPDDRRDELEEIMNKISVGSTVERLETVRRRKDGTEIQVVLSVWPLLNRQDEIVGATSVAHDITEQVRAARAREEAEVRFQAAFRQSPVGMVIADLAGRPTAVNPAICQMLGRRAEELVGHDWSNYLHADDAAGGPVIMTRFESGRESHSTDRRLVRPGGSVLCLQIDTTLVRDFADDPIYVISQMQDVTSRQAMERELQRRALHDELTGLANRALLNDRLQHALAAAPRQDQPVGVAFVDLDGFKHVNDVLGHAVGDRLLKEVGRRLVAGVRPADTVGRFGGDEFVVVADSVTVESMIRIVERIHDEVNRPFWVNGAEVGVQVSIGITISRSGSTAQSLLSEADAAMYRAKELGRGRYVVFDDSLRVRAAESLRGERMLRQAILRDEIVPHYQPIIDLRSGCAVGFEALARWPAGCDLAEPSAFVPLAESTGLIVAMGESVLTRSAADAAGWNRERTTPIWVSVNLSARQLADPNLVRMVERVLGNEGLRFDLLHLELTETSIMEDMVESVATLQQLKDLGVALSIDDFGTGYSSLSYLQQLPVDMLKIDRSFVRGLGSAEDDTAIVEAIIAMGRALGLGCVAEGVETADQHASLAAMGCDFGQGFLWSKALPAAEATGWVGARGGD